MADDDLTIPPFLRRPYGPEEKARIEKMVADANRREIRMPRDRRKVRSPGSGAKATGLGMAPTALRSHGASLKGETSTAPKRKPAMKIGAKEQALRAQREEVAKPQPADPANAAAAADTKETDMSTKKTAARKKAPAKKAAKASPVIRPGSKLEIVVGLLTRPEGCTAEEITTACNWPTVSVPQQARAAGLTLRKEKDGKISRYWATAA